MDYREVCAHWVPENPTDDDKAHCMRLGLSCIHLMCFTDQRDQFWAKTWLITQNLKPEKGCVIEKLSWDHKHVLVLHFLDHGDSLLIVIVVHLAYGGHFLQKASVTLPKYCPFA